MIEVKGLSKNYGEVRAIHDLHFSAEPGQVTGFLGPNGAGKTTTMRILSGFMPPTQGQAIVAGFDVFEKSMEVRRRVGYLPESVPLYRDMTAREYLMYHAEIRGLKKRGERADAVLERVGLTSRADSRIKALSKGMRQRVGLASALIHDPEVLILDEPTIGLDPFQVLELRELVRELGRDHTVLFSTHILSEAEQVCDKVVIIHRGEIVAQGAPGALRTDLGRGGRLLLRVQGEAAAAQRALQNVPSVASVEIGREGIVVTPRGDADPGPQVAQAIIAAGLPLLEMRPLAVNLEEIFLEITRRDAAQPDLERAAQEAEA